MAGVMVGKYCVVRCRDAGVHAGEVVSHDGREATLHRARRLWYWRTKSEGFLSGVARTGLRAGCKIGGEVVVHLTETCELIECHPDAEQSIRSYPVFENG